MFVVDQGAKIDDKTMEEAAAGGHMHILQFLVDKGIIPSTYILSTAVKTGSLELVKYLQDSKSLQ